MSNKDRLLLAKIVNYCEQIEQTRQLFDDSYNGFLSSHVFQNACCMCILQIGELAGRLSEQARNEIPDIPWRDIRGTRNVFAHDYTGIDVESVWKTINLGIPMLKARCQEALKDKIDPLR